MAARTVGCLSLKQRRHLYRMHGIDARIAFRRHEQNRRIQRPAFT